MPSVAASAAIRGLAREREAVAGDGEIEVLAHLVPLDHGADGERDGG
jgi:hypothetical protein